MARIVRTTLARADLRDIWLYVAQDSIDAADRFLDRIDRTIRMLAENPEIGE
jgi:toxin ParE1/3/4